MPSWEQIAEAFTRDVLNPSAVGNPDETPILFVGADLRALLNPCQCGGVNGFHSDDCLIGDRLAAVERERDEARADAESHRQGADQWYRRAMSARARIAAVEALADEVHGHGADDERAEVERLRGIISRIAVLATSPTPTGPERQAFIEELAGLPKGRRAEIFTPEPQRCEHGYSPHCYPMCVGPATPIEPTEETP